MAASITALVAIVALFLTIRENRKLQKERQDGDHKLAERKFAFDRDLVDIRRKTDLAEQALTLAYEARDVITSARSPGLRGGEGKTRKAVGSEEQDVAERRDTYFVPIERLMREAEIFSRLQSAKYPFIAYFGPEAAAPFVSLIAVRYEIISAASILIQTAASEGLPGVPVDRTLSQILFALTEQPDAVATKVNSAIDALEATCKPILGQRITVTG